MILILLLWNLVLLGPLFNNTTVVRAHDYDNSDGDGDGPHHGIYRWASGGISTGLPSMVTSMAIANIFSQAGIIVSSTNATSSSGNQTESTNATSSSSGNQTTAAQEEEESPHFSAISTTSGATWFATQLFYSQPFFDKTALSTPAQLSDFVLEWMNAYQSFANQNFLTYSQNNVCNMNVPAMNPIISYNTPVFYGTHVMHILLNMCLVLKDFQGDWAAFVNDMLNDVASSAYGHASFSDLHVNAENRIQVMTKTDLYLQTSMAPNSRIRSSGDTTSGNQVIYTGPDQSNSSQTDSIYSLPVGVQWSVNANTNNASYFSGGLPSETTTHEESNTSATFRWQDWERFGVFPADGSNSILLDDTSFVNAKAASSSSTGSSGMETQIAPPFNATRTGSLQSAFGGLAPTIGQISAASSAAAGFLSGLTPSVLMQASSAQRYEILQSHQYFDTLETPIGYVTDAVNLLYTSPLVDDVAVCTQWPNPCSDADARFMDGYLSDALTAALNIAQYQSQQRSGEDNVDDELVNTTSARKTMKLVITETSASIGTSYSFLSYFDTTINQGIEPGAFFWPLHPDSELWGRALFILPKFSPQIFADYLDKEIMTSKSQIVGDITNGVTVETFTISTTTVDNPAFGTSAGLAVDILFINIVLPTIAHGMFQESTMLIGEDVVEMAKQPLADMALSIASSTELLHRVQDFFGVARTGSSSSGSASIPATTWTLVVAILPALLSLVVAVTALMV